MAATNQSEEGKRIEDHMKAIYRLDEKNTYFAFVSNIMDKDSVSRVNTGKVKKAFRSPEEKESLYKFVYIYGGSAKAYGELKGIIESSKEPNDAVRVVNERLDKLKAAGITAESIMERNNDQYGLSVLADLERKAAARTALSTAALTPAGMLMSRKGLANITNEGGHGVTIAKKGLSANTSIWINLGTFVPGSKSNMVLIGDVARGDGSIAKVERVLLDKEKNEINVIFDNKGVVSIKIGKGWIRQEHNMSIEYHEPGGRDAEPKRVAFSVDRSGAIKNVTGMSKSAGASFPVHATTYKDEKMVSSVRGEINKKLAARTEKGGIKA